MKKVAYKCSFISVTTDQWPLVATESIPPPTSRALYKARSTSTFASTWRMCVAGKNLNSNQFVEVLSHLSFRNTTCSHLCIRDFIGKYVRGGRATIPANATSKRFNRQWRRLSNGLMELFEKTFLCVGSFLLDKNMAEHNQPISNNLSKVLKKVDF